MSMPASRIYSLRLFPLNSVLFPHFPIQLYVFEERYKAMISTCIERDEPLGVVLIREGEEVGAPAVPHEIGCEARILAVKRLEDGRMHLLAAGESRFRVLEYSEAELPYLVGRVETLEDLPDPSRDLTPLIGEVIGLFARYLQLLARAAGLPLPEMELPEDPTVLSFCIASVAEMSLQDKQRLLAMTDAGARLGEEIRLLGRQIQDMEAAPEELEEMEEAQPEPARVQVVIATPLDPEREHWKRFRDDSRN